MSVEELPGNAKSVVPVENVKLDDVPKGRPNLFVGDLLDPRKDAEGRIDVQFGEEG